MTTTYQEPRTLTFWGGMVLLLFPGVVVLQIVTDGWTGDRNQLIAAAVLLSMGGGLFWFVTSRWGPEFKSITVDEHGLTVGPRTLAPADIGRTWHLGRDAAPLKVARGRFRDGDATYKVTMSSFGFLITRDDVVVVEDVSADRPSVWFVATRDPEGLDAALRSLRP